MQIIYQIRFKTCEDVGDTFRSNTFAYSEFEQAMAEMEKEASQLVRVLSRDDNTSVECSTTEDERSICIMLSSVPYATVWIEDLMLV